jgi:hypothetical protein
MFTGGVGALVDLPNFSVLVRGIDDWTYPGIPEQVVERRLLAAVQRLEGMRSVERLQKAPWLDGIDADPNGEASRVGVPVVPFPDWLRCTACDELAPGTSTTFAFVNDNPHRPHEAKFVHADCPRSRRRPPLAVAARFVLSCVAGHLDDFPFRLFVHRGDTCPDAAQPRLRMQDRSANLGANVEIRCLSCSARRNVREALGKNGEQNLPACRGRHPHLRTFDPDGCTEKPKVLVVGASNQWFSQTLSALAVPKTGESELAAKVAEYWDQIEGFPQNVLAFARTAVPALQYFGAWTDDQLWAAMESHRASLAGEDDGEQGYPDLRTEEWEIFSATRHPAPTPDFALYRPGLAPEVTEFVDDVVQAERLREARALVGFSRLDAPDPEDPDLVKIAPLARARNPEWVPATEVRGEGLFVRLPGPLLHEWETDVDASPVLAAHRSGYARYRRNRYSDRLTATFDEMQFWPGARFIAMHTLSHLLIRTIALECGYSSASLSERIYAGSEDDPRSGILIYTAVPDAEGTLGGLVSLGEPRTFSRIFRRALRDAARCSSDPLCSERLPAAPADFLHGAACHVCLFVSETTCERANRFLDRRFVVPVDPAFRSIYKGQP